ncbi:MAG: hypothetical protein RL143_1375 [Pseudomonadota bacterium]
MNVSQALQQRKTVRAFTNKSVDPALIKSILQRASRAPSNGNIQPWKIYAVTGSTLEQIKQEAVSRHESGLPPDEKQEAVSRHESGLPPDEPEYTVYPMPLPAEYNERRKAIGEDLYNLLGVTREDKAGRQRQFAENGRMFGAPVALFAYVDRQLSLGQWMDLGMFLQSVMLLCEEEGLASCAQGYWSFFHTIVNKATNAPDELMLACGLAIGYEDKEAKINSLVATRLPVDGFTTFLD